MTMSERGTPEDIARQARIHQTIMDIASNVALRRQDLPPQIHVIIYDEISRERYGAYVGVRYIGDSGLAHITRTTIGRFAPGTTVMHIADILLEHDPGTPLVCDDTIANELSEGSVTWVEEGHYRLEGRPKGVLEVYTPYQTDKQPEGILPPGVASAQIFTE